MFSKSAQSYDEIYTSVDKDYPGEASKTHELGSFTHKQDMAAFKAAGLNTTHGLEELDGRGLYFGTNEQRRI